eukprot:m.143560 g.143560  ORF g.143560 m.143560 type:complete len:243 (+) comp9664_c0_seq2:689-1417(+)
MMDVVGNMTLQVIAGTAFGVRLGPEAAGQTAAFVAAAKELFGSSVQGANLHGILRFIFPFLADIYTYIPPTLPHSRRLYAARDLIDQFGFKQIVEKHRRHGEVPDGFLQLLLGAKDPESGLQLNDNEVIEQCRLMMLAGYETTANALTFSTYLLARNPAAEARLLAELADVGVPDYISYDDSQKYKVGHGVVIALMSFADVSTSSVSSRRPCGCTRPATPLCVKQSAAPPSAHTKSQKTRAS